MTASVEKLLRNAGYGGRANQKLSFSLTEAEAAAVYAAKTQMQRGDVFLVCDSGGGTTDLNVLKVTSATLGKTELQPLHYNEGEAVGSTLIDHKAESLLIDRLKRIRDELSDTPEVIAKQMLHDRFMSYKCDFGRPTSDVPRFFLPIKGMEPGKNFAHAGLQDSKIVLLK